MYFYLNRRDNVNFRCWDDVVIFAPFRLLRHAISSIWRNNETNHLDSNVFILDEICFFKIYFVTILVQCVRIGINVHGLDCSGTNIVVILLDFSVSNSITTIYVPKQSKQCTFIP